MTAKEKAKELVDKYFNLTDHMQFDEAKECALIAVDEILSFIEDDRKVFSWKEYYQQVKQEIEKL